MLKTLHNSSSRFAKARVQTGIFLTICLILEGCGGTRCSIVDKIFSEPSCHNLALNAKRVAIGGSASCLGASFSRKVSLSCPAGSGSALQCSSLSDGATAYVLLVSNNAAGSYSDTSGAVYSNCGDLWQAFYGGTLNQAVGYYVTGTDAASRLNCSDSSGCTASLGASCIAGWSTSTVPPGPSGTSSLPNGTSLLACVYIDNSQQAAPLPAPVSVGTWYMDFPQVLTVSGDLNFNTGWKDAY